MKTRTAGPTAALAGIPAGLQAQGVWTGRRQLFVRFAGEAETATMYTADALANEIERATTRSRFHSVAVGGRDICRLAKHSRPGGALWRICQTEVGDQFCLYVLLRLCLGLGGVDLIRL